MRTLLRLCLFTCLLLFGLIVLICAQQEDHTDLEALLVPQPGCDMPCFLGIRIGETHAGEAVAILEAHPWVGDVRTTGTGERQTGSIRFDWSPDAPRFLFSFRENALELEYGTEVVSGVSLHFHAQTGDLWRVLNNNHAVNGDPLAAYIRVDGPNCIHNPKAFYNAPPERVFYRTMPHNHPVPYVPLSERSSALRCN